jgi:hypothetical protein
MDAWNGVAMPEWPFLQQALYALRSAVLSY